MIRPTTALDRRKLFLPLQVARLACAKFGPVSTPEAPADRAEQRRFYQTLVPHIPSIDFEIMDAYGRNRFVSKHPLDILCDAKINCEHYDVSDA